MDATRLGCIHFVLLRDVFQACSNHLVFLLHLSGFESSTSSRACLYPVRRYLGRYDPIQKSTRHSESWLNPYRPETPGKSTFPDTIKLAYLYLTAFDTLKLLPVSKSIVQKQVDVEGLDSTENKYLLIQTDLGAGPLQLQTVCSRISVTKNAGTFINGFYQPGLSTQKAVTKEFIAKDNQWTRLPENRFDRRDVLLDLLADCSVLTDALKKDKINPLKKMNKILSLYNHCHLNNSFKG